MSTREARRLAPGKLVRVATGVSVITALGAGLGFFRDVLIARFFGATADTDAFFIAWIVPETATTLLQSAMVLTLVPLFTSELRSRGTLEPVVARSLAPIGLALGAVALATGAAAPLLARALAPGLENLDLAVQGLRIAALTIVFLGLAAYAAAALRTTNSFAVPATVFIAYNVGIISCLVLLRHELGVLSGVVGFVVGSVLTVAVQGPTFVRRVGTPRIALSLDRTLAASFVAAFVPIAAYAWLRQGQVYVERFFGSFLDAGAISHLSYATKVGQLPMTLALAIAIVSFPALARTAVAGKRELGEAVTRDLRTVIAIVAPAVAFFVAFAPELVAALFERGSFHPSDTSATSAILRVYALGIVGHSAVYIAALPFFLSRGHIWVPAAAGAVCVAVTIAVNAATIEWLGAVGIALGNVVGIVTMALLLLAVGSRRVATLDLGSCGSVAARSACAAGLAAALAVVVFEVLPLGLPAVAVAAGGVVLVGAGYLASAKMLGVHEVPAFVTSLLGRT